MARYIEKGGMTMRFPIDGAAIIVKAVAEYLAENCHES